jgi:hypothetical protein
MYAYLVFPCKTAQCKELHPMKHLGAEELTTEDTDTWGPYKQSPQRTIQCPSCGNSYFYSAMHLTRKTFVELLEFEDQI